VDPSSTVLSGSLLLAALVAALAGLVSFLSPCVLPLLPGYLAYTTGLGGAELAAAGSAGSPTGRSRLVLGSALFVLGFSAVFVSYGAAFGGLGSLLREYQRPISVVLGLVTVLLGLTFAGWLPVASPQWRLRAVAPVGLAGAPLLGATFGLGWTACVGPTLAAVLSLAFASDGASAARGALLSFAYCLGLGLPFVLAALGYRRALAASARVRAHQQLVVRAGGLMLVAVGLLLVTGLWDRWVASLQGAVAGFVPSL
jgi:cytochrome c-type biogenesis protein